MSRSAHGLSTPCGDWWKDAACGRYDPKWWELKGYNKRLSTANSSALRICGSCPVREKCDAESDERADAGLIRGGRAIWPKPTVNVFKPQVDPPTRRSSCGSLRGADVHRKHGEEPCEVCRAARARQDVNRRQKSRPGDPRFRRCSACEGWYPLNVLGELHAHKPWFEEVESTVEQCPGSRRLPLGESTVDEANISTTSSDCVA